MEKVKAMVLTEDWTTEETKEVAMEMSSDKFESFIEESTEVWVEVRTISRHQFSHAIQLCRCTQRTYQL